MQFKINSDKLVPVLKKLKTVKAYEKDDESLSSLSITTTNKNENPVYPLSEYTLTIVSMTNAFWSSITLTDEDFIDYGTETKKNWEVLESGKIFVNAVDFTDMLLAVPKGVVLDFQNKALTKTKSKGEFLSAKYSENKKKASLDFVITKPKFFDEEPARESRDSTSANGSSFINAIKTVAFASQALTSEDLPDPFLWGTLVEIRDSNVVAVATNRKRICFYDKEQSPKDPDFTFNPISTFLIPVVDVLDPEKNIDFEVGNKTTIVKQNKCIYVIPNVSEPEKFPNWRVILSKVKSMHKAKISFSKQSLASSLKLVGLASGSKMGVRIDLDTSKKAIGFATQIVDDGGFMKAVYEETAPLEDSQIIWTEDDQPIMETVLLNIAFLKDICDTFSKDENIILNFGTNNTPIIVEGTDSIHKYVLTSLEVGHKK